MKYDCYFVFNNKRFSTFFSRLHSFDFWFLIFDFLLAIILLTKLFETHRAKPFFEHFCESIESYFDKIFCQRMKQMRLKVWKWSKLYVPITLNIDLILWHTQLIACAEDVKSWFESWIFSIHFSSLYPAPYIELYVC